MVGYVWLINLMPSLSVALCINQQQYLPQIYMILYSKYIINRHELLKALVVWNMDKASAWLKLKLKLKPAFLSEIGVGEVRLYVSLWETDPTPSLINYHNKQFHANESMHLVPRLKFSSLQHDHCNLVSLSIVHLVNYAPIWCKKKTKNWWIAATARPQVLSKVIRISSPAPLSRPNILTSASKKSYDCDGHNTIPESLHKVICEVGLDLDVRNVTERGPEWNCPWCWK